MRSPRLSILASLSTLTALAAVSVPSVASAAPPVPPTAVDFVVTLANNGAADQDIVLNLLFAPAGADTTVDDIQVDFTHPYDDGMHSFTGTTLFSLGTTCDGSEIGLGVVWNYTHPMTLLSTQDDLTIICEQASDGAREYRFTIDRSNADALEDNYEQWSVEATMGTPSVPTIPAACVSATGLGGGGDAYFITNPGNQFSPSGKSCNDAPVVSTVLVLDKSGSMGGTPAGWAETKSEALNRSVEDLFIVWQTRRAFEGGIPGLDRDFVGIRYFDSAASVSAPQANFVELVPQPAASNSIHSDNGDLSDWLDPANFPAPGGTTSIGSGILAAEAMMTSPTTPIGAGAADRKVLVVMSDGIENVFPKVMCVGAGDCGTVDAAAVYTPFAGEFDRISAVTVGSPATVNEAIHEALSYSYEGGVYLAANSFDGALDGELRTYFLAILEDFLQFETVQATRLGSAHVTPDEPYFTTFELGSTGHDSTIEVMWGGYEGVVALFPPGGLDPIALSGSRFIHADLPHLPGEWGLALYTFEGSPEEFYFAVLEDDDVMHAEMDVLHDTFEPGEDLTVQARITGAGDFPLTGVTVEVDVTAPALSVGEFLSEYWVNPYGQGQNDVSVASAVLDAALAALSDCAPDGPACTPPELQTTVTLELHDDGLDGDVTADDGLYTALFPSTAPGNYYFDFRTIGASTPQGETFARAKTVIRHVRTVPDPEETQISSVTFTNDSGQIQTTLTVRPLTRGGYAVGPGWDAYLTANVNGTLRRFTDARNGDYVLELFGNVDATATVEVAFITALRPLGDAEWETQGVIEGLTTQFLGEEKLGNPDDGTCSVGSSGRNRSGAVWLFGLLVLGAAARRRRIKLQS
ncbi:MAG: VWA domain-containing protein [Nannocystaceae bacterium]|nr:VWA domain-containing protein [Nannocystaceae bacterium]